MPHALQQQTQVNQVQVGESRFTRSKAVRSALAALFQVRSAVENMTRHETEYVA